MHFSYRFITKVLSLPLGISLKNSTEIQRSEILSPMFADAEATISKTIRELGGDWEAVSHDIAVMDNSLVLSVLLRRGSQ